MDRGLVKWISSSTILASMCCLPSVIMVMFGLSSVTTAAALSDTLYWGTDGYWWFRPTLLTASAIMVIVGLISYFRKQGVCTFDDVKKDKRRVVNVSLLVLTIAFVSYMIFNYVILEILGIAVGLPWEDDAFWN
ncbi:MAG: hypothetical protein VX366_07380 [Candidatus Thermoplasmatota archaeon]|nr:hypothetical protein [Euryarchaeota archaeon]MDP7373939.1 hypothetical protein [Candidatus Poseidoniaceae archaeon]MEE2986019.1 hypothetical protein [Candidatus Thermoplasmatota archaeon]|tara:strand:+ start:89 stop:490 length:402 start_codon:yes stop_codon:yes gene_type:complete